MKLNALKLLLTRKTSTDPKTRVTFKNFLYTIKLLVNL